MKNVNSSLRRLLFCAFILICFSTPQLVSAAKLKTENVFLIMSDGLRWQEVFRGAEEALIESQTGGVQNTNALRQQFWRNSAEERRAVLLPFFWSEIARHGQLFGNTNKGSVAKLTNGKKFSYPGYNEVLSGFGDPRINSNDKNWNTNVTVFEWLNQQRRFAGRTALFGNWDVFAYIFNVERSGLPIWPVWESKFAKNQIRVTDDLESLFHDTTGQWEGATMDSFIFCGAHNYLKEKQPRLMFVGFGETDEWAHARRYDLYLGAAHHVDSFVQRLWETVQSIPHYRGKTTFIITCDHGRGNGENWTDHGRGVQGAENIWLAVIGPDTEALGERTNCAIGQNQIAATLAALLGEDFYAAFPKAGSSINEIVGKR